MIPEKELSAWYQSMARILLAGPWEAKRGGPYGELAHEMGYSQVTKRAAQVVGQLVKSFALRHPNWDHSLVYSKRTGRPAYEG